MRGDAVDPSDGNVPHLPPEHTASLAVNALPGISQPPLQLNGPI